MMPGEKIINLPIYMHPVGVRRVYLYNCFHDDTWYIVIDLFYNVKRYMEINQMKACYYTARSRVRSPWNSLHADIWEEHFSPGVKTKDGTGTIPSWQNEEPAKGLLQMGLSERDRHPELDALAHDV